MGCQKVNVLFLGLSEVYFACYNLFLQFLYYKRGNKRLKTVLSMQSCGAPYIESIVTLDLLFLRIRKDLLCMGFLLNEILKKAEAMEKRYS